MGLHDFRRAAATFLTMDAPEKIGLIPGLLPHDYIQTAQRRRPAYETRDDPSNQSLPISNPVSGFAIWKLKSGRAKCG
jgi:hypothetical protein